MADGDTKGGKECVEGYDPKEKKLLEKVSAPARLQELKRDQAQQDIKVKKELEHEQKLLMDLQNKLSDCNREYGDTKRQLEKLRLEQDVKLTPTQRQDITRTTRNLVGSFLQQRQRDAEDRDIDVDVRYLSSMEEHKVGLRLGGEAGGSKDAKFSVRLSDTVKSLTSRAAMYWGLDADKVFILDRDGRVIFDDVCLRDIILPPKQQTSASSSLAVPAAADGNPKGDPGESHASSELEAISEEEMYTVKGRNYQLTLVRALRPGEVLTRGQANKHSSQGWFDFTFDERRLNADLQETARKFGDPDFQDDHVEMHDIPQLYDLIEEGKERKRLKRKDMACRLVEFLIFLVAFAFHSSALLVDTASSTQMFHISETVQRSLTEFDNEERRYLGVSSFFEVATERQYRAWVRGPLQRSVLPPATPVVVSRRLNVAEAGPPGAGGPDGTEGTAGGQGTADTNGTNRAWERGPLQRSVRRRLNEGEAGQSGTDGTDGTAGEQGTAGTDGSPGTAGGAGAPGAPGGSTANDTAADGSTMRMMDPTRAELVSKNLFTVALVGVRYQGGMSTTNVEADWCPTAPSQSGGVAADDDDNSSSNESESTTTPPSPSSSGCSPDSLRGCLNKRVVDIFTQALSDGQLVPNCKLESYLNPVAALVASWQQENDFTFYAGDAGTYVGGDRSVIELTNSTTFDETVGDMEVADATVPARLFLIFVFTPTLNGLFVFKMLVENTQCGGLITSRSLFVIRLAPGRPYIFAASVLAILLALFCFFLEVRRIMACPKRCTFERERTPCSCWTFVFLLMPMVMLLAFSIFWARSNLVSTNDALHLDPDTGSLSSSSVALLFSLTSLDYYYNLVNMLVLFSLNVLFLHYLLMFFPALSFTATMVAKLVTPLFMTFLYCVTALFLLASCFYMVYAANFVRFSNLVVSLIQAIIFAQGGLQDWYSLWQESPAIYTILLIIGFVVIHLVLEKMAAAVMLSYKKEKDLRQNYSYHRFWTTEVSKKGKTKAEFNPARIFEPPKQTEPGMHMHS